MPTRRAARKMVSPSRISTSRSSRMKVLGFWLPLVLIEQPSDLPGHFSIQTTNLLLTQIEQPISAMITVQRIGVDSMKYQAKTNTTHNGRVHNSTLQNVDDNYE